mmetsp:Transcript_3428/g.4660  ORF Transcript_3428/g.4660 Transcript_3428/m.4660 type:complete len:297 (+) Transcript_3428:1054-1944(+)
MHAVHLDEGRHHPPRRLRQQGRRRGPLRPDQGDDGQHRKQLREGEARRAPRQALQRRRGHQGGGCERGGGRREEGPGGRCPERHPRGRGGGRAARGRKRPALRVPDAGGAQGRVDLRGQDRRRDRGARHPDPGQADNPQRRHERGGHRGEAARGGRRRDVHEGHELGGRGVRGHDRGRGHRPHQGRQDRASGRVQRLVSDDDRRGHHRRDPRGQACRATNAGRRRNGRHGRHGRHVLSRSTHEEGFHHHFISSDVRARRRLLLAYLTAVAKPPACLAIPVYQTLPHTLTDDELLDW